MKWSCTVRITAYIMAAFLLVNSLADAYCIKAEASSAGSAMAAADLAMTIYGILESGAIAGGVKDGFEDYASGKSMYDAFMDVLQSVTLMDDPSDRVYLGEVTLEDGTTVDISSYVAENGGNLQLPDENTWKKYRDGSTAFGIASVVLGSGMLSTLGSFITDVFDGKVDGLNKDDYITSVGSWNYDRDADGHYLISGTVDYVPNSTQHGVYTLSGYVAYIPVACFRGNNIYFLYLNPATGVLSASYASGFSSGSYHANFEEQFDLYLNLDGSLVSTRSNIVPNYVECSSRSYKLNIPVFESSSQAVSHFHNGTWDGLLNGSSVDYTTLAAASAATLAALAGTSIKPGSLTGFNKALSEAAASASAAGAVADNTAAYIAALTAVIADFDFTQTNISDKVDDLASTVPALLKDIKDLIEVIPSEIVNISEILSPFPAALTELRDSVETIPGILNAWSDSITGIPAALKSLLDTVSIFPSADLTAVLKILPRSLDDILNGIRSIPDALAGVLAGVLAIPDALSDALRELLAAVGSLPRAIAKEFNIPDGGSSDDSDDPGSGGPVGGMPSLLNSLMLIIFILIVLLKIFLHCLQFIICIFRIPATTGFLPDEMVMGFNYLKAIEITGIGISVFDFMMGLIHIMIIFGIVRLLRKMVDQLHLPHK